MTIVSPLEDFAKLSVNELKQFTDKIYSVVTIDMFADGIHLRILYLVVMILTRVYNICNYIIATKLLKFFLGVVYPLLIEI